MTAIPIPDAALESHIGILGKTGSGKSNAAKVVAEVLMARGERVAVVDPTGTWWGLRLRPDGTPSRFKPVIFGGAHGDVAIGGQHGAAIGEAVATSESSVIIDTRQLSVGDRTRFFTDFAETLLRKNAGPLTAMIDEAHLFMPQAGAKAGGAAPAMLHAGNNLVSLGRGVGLRIVLISQRPAKLHKDSLTQVETLVAMRLLHNLDVDAVRAWIGEWAEPAQGKELIASLPSLATGDAWVWSPELGRLERVHFPLVVTFDSGKPPKAGETGPELKPIDISAIAGRLEAIGREVLANDPRTLKAKVTELTRELEAAQKNAQNGHKNAPAMDPEALAEAEQRGRVHGYADGYRAGKAFGGRHAAHAQAIRMVEGLGRAAMINGDGDALALALKAMKAIVIEDPDAPVVPPKKERGGRPAPRPVNQIPEKAVPGKPTSLFPATHEGEKINVAAAGGALTPAKQRILIALRQFEAIGKAEADRDAVGWFAGATPQSSGFANNLGSLRTAGLIDYPAGGKVKLTEAGQALVPQMPAPTHGDIVALVRGKVTPAQFRLLQVAINAWPDDLSSDDLATMAEASPTSSGFANNKGRLRSLGLIDYPSQGRVRAGDVLFP